MCVVAPPKLTSDKMVCCDVTRNTSIEPWILVAEATLVIFWWQLQESIYRIVGNFRMVLISVYFVWAFCMWKYKLRKFEQSEILHEPWPRNTGWIRLVSLVFCQIFERPTHTSISISPSITTKRLICLEIEHHAVLQAAWMWSGSPSIRKFILWGFGQIWKFAPTKISRFRVATYQMICKNIASSNSCPTPPYFVAPVLDIITFLFFGHTAQKEAGENESFFRAKFFFRDQFLVSSANCLHLTLLILYFSCLVLS